MFRYTRIPGPGARLILQAIVFTVLSFASAPGKEPWFRRALVGMEIGPTGAQFGHSDTNDTRYAARFNGREIVQRAVEAHSEYVVIWARDGDYAYYNSKVARQCPGLGKRDVLEETVSEARKHQLPVIAYCVVQQGGHFLADHPQFEMRGADGKPIGRFCYNSGYLEPMKRLLIEMLAYGIEGFHIDMLDQGFAAPYGCWCQHCEELFQKTYGHALPKGVTWDEAWDDMMAFRYESSARFERALAEHVRSLNPQATVDFNYHGNPPFSWEVGQRPVQHAGWGDFVTGETGVWGFSALTVGLNATWYRASTSGQRYQVAMQRGVRMYHDQTTRPLADLRWELLTLLAHGAFVTVVDKTAFDGWLDPLCYERVGAAFDDALARRKHFGHTPLVEVGLYFSARTRDWFAREKPTGYFQSFLGAHKALVAAHIPYGVVFDESATLERLRPFAVVWLPQVTILSANEIQVLRQYVERGGRLLVTGWTGSLGSRGEPQASPEWESLIGAKWERKLDSLDNHLRFPSGTAPASQGALAQDIRMDWPFLVKGPAVVYKNTTASPCGQLLVPHRTIRQIQGKEGTEWPMSADQVVGPAALLATHGRGQVLTLAASPDWASASDHGIVEARWLIRNAVRLLHPHPRVRITAPANVETVVTDDSANRTLRVHLLGYFAPPQTMPATGRPYVLPALLEDLPVFDAELEFPDRVRTASTWNNISRLEKHGRKLKVTVRDVHDVVVIKY